MEELNDIEKNGGVVKISDEVISVIAGIAAGEIEGITVCAQGVTNNITNKIFKGKKLPEKATKVQLEGDKANIDLSVAVEYGTKIKEAVEKVQENVKLTVEAMTGLVVGSVNVFVSDIYLKEKEKKEV
ncbi:MAG: Asp23/Gls24 family envelope stress response protein [Clostridiales bacterium]|nr:Asp23/Gls24 family envelope stress response protein [Clostridiales bacterium]MDY2728574.1 Asp23/Gls24 family envelope stress response protein [Clostridium sp.]